MRTHAFASIAVFAVLAAFESAAYGQPWSRQHGMTCRPGSAIAADQFEIHTVGVTNTSDDLLLDIVCPSFDTDYHPDGDVPRVRVYVYDGNAIFGIVVQACRTFRNTLGAVCGPARGTSGPFIGNAVITLEGDDLDVWDPLEFGYIHIILPPNGFEPGPFGGGGLSYVKGWITGG